MKNGRTAFTIVCNKKLNFWLSLFCSRGKDIVAKDTIWRGISSFTFVSIDRIGLKDAHVYQNLFITVSVKGTDKTFRSLDNWHLQTCVESANMVAMRKASTCWNSLPSCENYFRLLTRKEYAICRSLRQIEINLPRKNYLPELTPSHFIPRRTTMIFGISCYGSYNCHAIFCGAKGLGEGASCGNVPVKI